METISFEDFMKVDLRVGRIINAEKVPGADKLLLLTVDLGSEERKLVAGIAPWYKETDLIGKLIVVVANLEPKKIRGITSQGMLLAADAEKPVLLTVIEDVPPGTKIR
ncbi:MAG: methionine--tRNA ligase subunit beta [Candidatus Njordarchaeia archaeon]|nr:methionine--tRNA ligase subunit beta [Candidatus Korarchaeota archaeon]